MREIILATRNQHKISELESILRDTIPGVTVRGDTGDAPAETGVTFAANALLKARDTAVRTGKLAVADDSGIAVDVLGGAPGIFSARWAGANSSDTANLELLLQQLADISPEHRAAAFVCAAAAVKPLPDGTLREISVTARWEGTLLTEPRGAGGFGYDPIFQPAGYSVSAAELSAEVKNSISHRHLAFTQLAPRLRELLES